jgi:hypothetical protein
MGGATVPARRAAGRASAVSTAQGRTRKNATTGTSLDD